MCWWDRERPDLNTSFPPHSVVSYSTKNSQPALRVFISSFIRITRVSIFASTSQSSSLALLRVKVPSNPSLLVDLYNRLPCVQQNRTRNPVKINPSHFATIYFPKTPLRQSENKNKYYERCLTSFQVLRIRLRIRLTRHKISRMKNLSSIISMRALRMIPADWRVIWVKMHWRRCGESCHVAWVCFCSPKCVKERRFFCQWFCFLFPWIWCLMFLDHANEWNGLWPSSYRRPTRVCWYAHSPPCPRTSPATVWHRTRHHQPFFDPVTFRKTTLSRKSLWIDSIRIRSWRRRSRMGFYVSRRISCRSHSYLASDSRCRRLWSNLLDWRSETSFTLGSKTWLIFTAWDKTKRWTGCKSLDWEDLKPDFIVISTSRTWWIGTLTDDVSTLTFLSWSFRMMEDSELPGRLSTRVSLFFSFCSFLHLYTLLFSFLLSGIAFSFYSLAFFPWSLLVLSCDFFFGTVLDFLFDIHSLQFILLWLPTSKSELWICLFV